MKKHKKRLSIIIVIATVVIIASVIGIINYNATQQEKAEAAKKLATEKKYLKTMHQFVSDGMDAGTKAEDMASELQDVWYDAIFEDTYKIDDKTYRSGEDFNDALQAKYTALEKSGDVEELETYQSDLEKDMKELKNPPAKYKDIYQDIVDVYGPLQEFVQLVDDPEGSLDSFTDKVNELDSEVAKKLKSVEVQLPEN